MSITLKEALKPYLEHDRWPSLAAADAFTDALARGRISDLHYRPYERQPAFCRYCGEELTKRVQGHVTHAARAGGPWHSIWQDGPEASAYCTEALDHKHVPGDAS